MRPARAGEPKELKDEGVDLLMANAQDGQLVDLFYGITRTYVPRQQCEMRRKFRVILERLFLEDEAVASADWDRGALVAIVLQTRDVKHGKGEYGAFYGLVAEWFGIVRGRRDKLSTAGPHSEHQLLAALDDLLIQVVWSAMELPDGGRGYGSWKDYKYVFEYLIREAGEGAVCGSALFKECTARYARQLWADGTEGSTPSLAGKWAPREKSKRFGLLARYLAAAMWPSWAAEGRVRRCLTHYRRYTSELNARLGTIQVKQCSGSWRDIDFREATSGTLTRQAAAFARGGAAHRPYVAYDRAVCARNYTAYLLDCISGKASVPALPSDAVPLVKRAIRLAECGGGSPADACSYDLQWQAGEHPKGAHPDCLLPMIDLSCSLRGRSGDHFAAAIAIGLRLIEGSVLGRRLLTLGASPAWVCLNSSPTLTSAVRTLMGSCSQGGDTDFRAGLEMVASACAEANLSGESVGRLTLVLISDMDFGSEDRMQRVSEDVWRAAGLRTAHRTPYPCPHMVYWSLDPDRAMVPASLVHRSKCTLLSGYSTALLNSICSSGPSEIGAGVCTPMNGLRRAVAGQRRYEWAWHAASQVPRPGAVPNTQSRAWW